MVNLATKKFQKSFSDFNHIAQRFKFQEVERAFKTRDLALDHIYELTFNPELPLGEIQNALESLPYVEYCAPIPVHHSNFLPNDWSTFDDLWHLERINAQAAWDITKGSDEVVIAIVDDAVLINHEDLADNIWVNSRRNSEQWCG